MSVQDDNTTWRHFGACNIRMSEYHSILEDVHTAQTLSMLRKYTTDPPEGMMMGSVDVVHQGKQLVSVANSSESELEAMAGDQRTWFACNRSSLDSGGRRRSLKGI